MRFRLCSVVVAALALGCAGSGSSETTGQAANRIIGGQPDTSHQAVVWLGMCSGTIVRVDAQTGTGYVLTAAHCFDGMSQFQGYVAQGDDYWAPDAVYPAIDFEVHPDYQTEAIDLAVVRFSGATASTPVLAAATGGDGLTVGASVTSVGYGQIYAPGQTPVSNQVRNHIDKELFRVWFHHITYQQQGGGICFGDSGGPVLAPVAGETRVVAVHTSVGTFCDGQGTSTKVGPQYASWLADALDDPGPLPTDCGLSAPDAAGAACIETTCCAEAQACAAEEIGCFPCAVGTYEPFEYACQSSAAYAQVQACVATCAGAGGTGQGGSGTGGAGVGGAGTGGVGGGGGASPGPGPDGGGGSTHAASADPPSHDGDTGCGVAPATARSPITALGWLIVLWLGRRRRVSAAGALRRQAP